jgi:hypothetical protein
MDRDTMHGKILPDGTIKLTTDEVSPENHLAADAFLGELASHTGGQETRERRGDASHVHTHHDTGITHSH